MPATRRHLLGTIAGVASVTGIAGLAGCSSSCPDSDSPTPETTVSIRTDPRGPFETTPAGEWNGFGGDAGNTGYADRSIPDGDLVVRWRTDIDLPATDSGGLSASAPTVGGGMVVVGDERRVHAYSSRTGAHRWTSDDISPTANDSIDEHRAETTAPAVGPAGTVFVGTTDGLVALDGDDGSVRWRNDSIEAAGTPSVADGTVIALGRDELLAMGVDGDEWWRRAVDRGEEPTSPAIGDERIVAPTESGILAVAVGTGEREWNRALQVDTPPVVAASTCLVGTDDGLRAIDVSTGDSLWTFSRGDYRALRSPVVTPETIYTVEQPGEAGAATFALERTDGEPTPRWCSYVGDGAVTAATDALALTSTSLDSGPDSAQSVLAFTTNLGESPWAIEGGSHPRAWVNPPAIVDGAIVVTTRGGTMVAIGGGD
ncbi:MAG: PQQ-binding-like beta-propeller repeat protein [Halanaeroarchaeum sp.]